MFLWRPFLERREVGAVDVVGPKVDVERLLLGRGLVDELQGRVSEAGGDVGAVHPGDRAPKAFGIDPDLLRLLVAGLEREREELRSHPFKIGQRDVITVGRDRGGIVDVALAAEVPFTKMPRRVADVLQRAGERRRLRIQPLGVAATGVLGAVIEEGVDAPALRVLARHERAAGRGADGRVDVELGEAETFGRQPVDVRRLYFLVTEAREVAPAHVIDEHEDEVRFLGRSLTRCERGTEAGK